MKTLSAILFSLAVAGTCAIAATEQEISQWKEKAEAGDVKAARELAALYRHTDPGELLKWQMMVVELGDATECLRFARMIRRGDPTVKQSGTMPQEVVRKLLTICSATSGLVAYELGEAYRTGYLDGPEKDSQARAAYQQAASLYESASWERLAEMYRDGTGGAADPAQACYYSALATRFGPQGTEDANRLWQLWRDTEARLPLAQLKEAWARLDDFTEEARKRDEARCRTPDNPTGPPDFALMNWYHHRKSTDELEQKHRTEQERIKGRQEAIAAGDQP